MRTFDLNVLFILENILIWFIVAYKCSIMLIVLATAVRSEKVIGTTVAFVFRSAVVRTRHNKIHCKRGKRMMKAHQPSKSSTGESKKTPHKGKK